MTAIYIGGESEKTGPLEIRKPISEENMQRIFAALLGLSGPRTNEDGTQRPSTLGEVLRDSAQEFFNMLNAKVDQWDEIEALRKAREAKPPPLDLKLE